jgi:peptide/nickel transport system permease protein
MTARNAGTAAWREVLARLRRDPRSLAALSVLIAMTLLVLVGPLLSPYQPYEQLDIVANVHRSPDARHLLGTDAFSRDVLSRVLSGGRISLAVAAGAVLIESLIGLLWGVTAGLAGGAIDRVMMRIVDAGRAIPRVLLLLVTLASVPLVPIWLLVLLLGLTGWFSIARLIRGDVRVIAASDAVVAARALGCTPARLAFRHVVPHVTGSLLTLATLGIGQVIMLESGLSWLGIGIRPPQASWGNIIADGTEFLATAPWVSLSPGLCLVVVVLAISTLGDGLREALAPRQLPGS